MEWVKIFGTDERKDRSGGTRVFTAADLQRIVDSYRPEYHEAPVAIEPVKDTSPAWGWVAGMKTIGGNLFAKFRQVQPEFKNMFAANKFSKRAISLHPDGSLRSVIFGGAPAPRLPGLNNFASCEPDDLTFDFSEAGIEDNHFPIGVNCGHKTDFCRDFSELELGVMEIDELVMRA